MAPCYLKGITSNTAYKELITLLEEYSTTFTFTFTVGRATPPLGHEPIAAASFGLPKTYLENITVAQISTAVREGMGKAHDGTNRTAAQQEAVQHATLLEALTPKPKDTMKAIDLALCLDGFPRCSPHLPLSSAGRRAHDRRGNADLRPLP